MLTKISKTTKTKISKCEQIHVGNFQGRHFLTKKAPAGTLHNIAKGLVPVFAAICR
jgi:hypothetical protein